MGDTIRVVFRNNGPPVQHAPARRVLREGFRGRAYNDAAARADKADDGVPPGGTYVYVWPVPERAGPADGRSSVLWMYHSHVDEVRDINTGLLGPMIVTARGMARPDGTPRDVDREIVAAFAEVDENESWLTDEQGESALPGDRRTRGPSPTRRRPTQATMFVNSRSTATSTATCPCRPHDAAGERVAGT